MLRATQITNHKNVLLVIHYSYVNVMDILFNITLVITLSNCNFTHLSPILFALFVNDLQNFFELNDCRGIYNYFYASIDMYFKIMMLLYAYDTVILAETALDLQHSLNYLYEYSSLWKLNVNRSKTKIVIFGSNTRSIRNEYIF